MEQLGERSVNSGEASEDEPESIRSAPEIARRAIALFGVVGVGLGADRDEVLQWLTAEGLDDSLTPRERVMLEGPAPSPKQLLNAGWQSEALLMLLWALKRIDDLPGPDTQCDMEAWQALLPPYTDEPVSEFIGNAVRRDDDTLIGMADEILDLHWQARNAALHERAESTNVDIEIIQERHWGINWVIGYDGAPWDEVTTDT